MPSTEFYVEFAKINFEWSRYYFVRDLAIEFFNWTLPTDFELDLVNTFFKAILYASIAIFFFTLKR